MLSYNELVEIVEAGYIRNVEPNQINGASIDVRLGQWVMKEREPEESGHRVEVYFGQIADTTLHKINFRKRDPLITVKHDLIRQPIVLMPGEFCIAQTIEEFHLPNFIAAEFKLKSSSARSGINNLFAGLADPGWHSSVLTLELHNTTRYHAITLQYGDAVGQMIFHRVEPVPADKSYAARGRYNNDKTAQVIKL